jgi:hypothetical protein
LLDCRKGLAGGRGAFFGKLLALIVFGHWTHSWSSLSVGEETSSSHATTLSSHATTLSSHATTLSSHATTLGRSAGGVGYSVKFPITRAIAARVSVPVETHATFTAKPEAQPPEVGFALLKALCIAAAKAPIRTQPSRERYGSGHLQIFIGRDVWLNYGIGRGLELCA